MNNKDNKYNQYRKKRVSAHLLACYASKKKLKKVYEKFTESELGEISLFWAFYADTVVDKKGIRFNNHKHE